MIERPLSHIGAVSQTPESEWTIPHLLPGSSYERMQLKDEVIAGFSIEIPNSTARTLGLLDSMALIPHEVIQTMVQQNGERLT